MNNEHFYDFGEEIMGGLGIDSDMDGDDSADAPDSADGADGADGAESGGTAQSRLAKKVAPKIFVVLAAVMLFFSTIGVIVSVDFVYERIHNIRDRHSLKEELARFIAPVVINDPPAFNAVDSLQPSTVITSAIWKIILIGDKSNYGRDMGVIYVPAADVERAAQSIFGTGALEHQDIVGFGQVDFIYLEHEKAYAIPENPNMHLNSPLITALSNTGEIYTVTVDYIAPNPLAIAGIKHSTGPIKTMVYTISRTKERMTIMSIQPVPDTA